MSEAPKKIWIYGKQWQESPEFYPMTFESDKPMVSKESYIRADLVDELVELVEVLKMGTYEPYCECEKCKEVRTAIAKLEESHDWDKPEEN